MLNWALAAARTRFCYTSGAQIWTLFGHLLDSCPPPFRRQKHLRSSLGCSCGLLLRPLLHPLMLSGIRKESLLALLSLLFLLGSHLLPLGSLFKTILSHAVRKPCFSTSIPRGPNPRFADAASADAERTLKSRSRLLPTHPGMMYIRKGNPRC